MTHTARDSIDYSNDKVIAVLIRDRIADLPTMGDRWKAVGAAFRALDFATLQAVIDAHPAETGLHAHGRLWLMILIGRLRKARTDHDAAAVERLAVACRKLQYAVPARYDA